MYAQRIANQYPPKLAPLYQAAAKTLRQPYWDWAAYHSLPRAAILRNLTINGPNGPSTIRNPLSSYQFQIIPLGSGFSGPLATYPETVRCPVEGGSDMDSALSDTNLNLPALGLTSMTVRCLGSLPFRFYILHTLRGYVFSYSVHNVCL
jgi:tyrosinase